MGRDWGELVDMKITDKKRNILILFEIINWKHTSSVYFAWLPSIRVFPSVSRESWA